MAIIFMVAEAEMYRTSCLPLPIEQVFLNLQRQQGQTVAFPLILLCSTMDKYVSS